MILVTGATGPAGRQVVDGLLAAGEPVRALTRDPARASLPDGVEVAAGDLTRPETLGPAMSGVDRVFVLLPTFGAPEAGSYDGHVVDAAREHGVQHLVRVSVIAVGDDDATDRHTSFHRDGEARVRESGLRWTFLRPGQFMTNALSWAEGIASEGCVREPYADVKQAPIDPADIAACAVVALREPGHEGQVYPLTGPQALSLEEQIAILSEVLDRPIKAVNVPPDEARSGWLEQGYPVGMVDGIMRHMADESGVHGTVQPWVERLTGRATTFREWATANAGAFES